MGSRLMPTGLSQKCFGSLGFDALVVSSQECGLKLPVRRAGGRVRQPEQHKPPRGGQTTGFTPPHRGHKRPNERTNEQRQSC